MVRINLEDVRERNQQIYGLQKEELNSNDNFIFHMKKYETG